MNRMTKKELPHTEPTRAKPLPLVQDTIRRAVQREQDEKEVRAASGFLDRFLRLFSDYSHHSGRTHKRKLGAVSSRSPKEIQATVTAFFTQRPRPWRHAGNQAKPMHAIRFRRYRRAPASP